VSLTLGAPVLPPAPDAHQRPNAAAANGGAMSTGASPGVDPSRLASRVLTRSLHLKRGENVIIETWTHGIPLAEAFVVEARRLGVRPMVLYEGERSFFEMHKVASPRDASAIGAAELAAVAAADAYVYLPGPDDLKRWVELPAVRRETLDRVIDDWNQVLRRHSVRAVYLHYAAATPLAAQEYGVDVDAWRRETLEGSAIDPAALRRGAHAVASHLWRGHRLTVTHPNGTRLDLALAGRAPLVEDGSVDAEDLRAGRNWTVLPAGFLITAVHERTAEGLFVANRPSRRRRGVVEGARWSFREGRLDEYHHEKGGEMVEESFQKAGRERDRPALFQLGLNPKLRDAPLQEDQERGIVTLYIGHNDDFGGRTRGGFRDYALIEGADVAVDGRPVLRAGQLV